MQKYWRVDKELLTLDMNPFLKEGGEHKLLLQDLENQSIYNKKDIDGKKYYTEIIKLAYGVFSTYQDGNFTIGIDIFNEFVEFFQSKNSITKDLEIDKKIFMNSLEKSKEIFERKFIVKLDKNNYFTIY